MLKNSTESQRWSSFKTFYFCTTICCFTQEQPVELVLTPWPSIRLSISSLYLKELHSDTSKHELQQRGDDHDVANSPDGHKDTLDHMLQNTHSYTLLIQSSIINKGAWMHKYTGETHSQWKLDTYIQIQTASCCVIASLTLSPLALLMALSGRRTLKTRRIFTTEIAEDLQKTGKHTSGFSCALSRTCCHRGIYLIPANNRAKGNDYLLLQKYNTVAQWYISTVGDVLKKNNITIYFINAL